METVTIHDKKFRISIDSGKIQDAIGKMAQKMNQELKDKDVVFVAILNGAFMFASDLMKRISFSCRITFLKLASYEGTDSTCEIKQLIGLNESLNGKTVVVIDDIVDTGVTLDSIIRQVTSFQPAAIKIATLLLKPGPYKYQYKPDYVGFSIAHDFVIGYGLDYKGYGRNLESIYTIIDS
jgi:hypoxanthine phosphoribosyltransferase